MTPPTDFPIVVEQGGMLSGAGGDFLLQILAGLAVAVLSFLLGFNRGKTYNVTINDNSVHIHAAILKASSAAMAASSNELHARAQALRNHLTDLLGPVLDLSRGVSAPLKALDDALKGEKKVDAKTSPIAPTAADAKTGCICGKPQACGCKTAAPVTVNQVYIGGAPIAGPSDGKQTYRPGAGHGGSSEPAPSPAPLAKPETIAMTGPEQVEALAKAVRQFHDHWLDGPARIRELRAAREALSRRPPAPVTGSAGHGHGH